MEPSPQNSQPNPQSINPNPGKTALHMAASLFLPLSPSRAVSLSLFLPLFMSIYVCLSVCRLLSVSLSLCLREDGAAHGGVARRRIPGCNPETKPRNPEIQPRNQPPKPYKSNLETLKPLTSLW